jgi:branched-chain amino acid transport system permease protein
MTTVPKEAEAAIAAVPVRQAAGFRPGARHYVIAVAIAVALIVPFLLRSFVIFQLTEVMIAGLAILGLNLLTGFNGQFSLGHSAFYGIGAYTTAILMHNYDVPYFLTLPAAGGVCFVVGFLFGLPALRLQNLYLALATFALAVAVPQILKFRGLEEWTGGVQGLFVLQPDPPEFLPKFLKITTDQWLYYFTLAVVLAMFAAASNLIRSRSGRAIKAIRDNQIAAAAMGVNTSLYKTLTFGVSALYTGVAGALSALVVAFVAPDSFNFLLSVSFLVGLVIGGVGSIPGCLFGGLFVLYVPNIANSLSNGLAGAIFGVILLVVVFVIPAGAAGVPRMARQAYAAPTIGRAQFFPLWFIVSVVAGVLDVTIQHTGWSSPLTILAMLIVTVPAALAQLYLAVKRLRDIPASARWSLVLLIPALNVILLFVLFFARGRVGSSPGPKILAEGRVTP